MPFQQITIETPEKVLLAEKTDAESFGREILVLAAVKLFEIGRLSSGSASELAGMTRIEFLLNLNRYKAFPFAAELEDFEQRLGGDSSSVLALADPIHQSAGMLADPPHSLMADLLAEHASERGEAFSPLKLC